MSGLEVRGLSKHFEDRVAVEGLSFEVKPEEVFGLLGPNGAGKTTTVRMLAGLLRPTSGEATVCGLSVATGGERLRRQVGLLTEQPGLYDRLTARENLLFFIRLNELDEAAAWERARRYLQRFGLAGREDEPCGTFSKGMRQKLAIIRAILHEPAVIFLDEPTSGLDPEAAKSVRDSVAELAAEGRTIVLCTHNLAEVERLCKRVAIIRQTQLAVAEVSALRRTAAQVVIRVAGDAARLEAGLLALPLVSGVRSGQGSLSVSLSDSAVVPEVVAHLVGAGARVLAVTLSERPLEDAYLDLVGRSGSAS